MPATNPESLAVVPRRTSAFDRPVGEWGPDQQFSNQLICWILSLPPPWAVRGILREATMVFPQWSPAELAVRLSILVEVARSTAGQIVQLHWITNPIPTPHDQPRPAPPVGSTISIQGRIVRRILGSNSWSTLQHPYNSNTRGMFPLQAVAIPPGRIQAMCAEIWQYGPPFSFIMIKNFLHFAQNLAQPGQDADIAHLVLGSFKETANLCYAADDLPLSPNEHNYLIPADFLTKVIA